MASTKFQLVAISVLSSANIWLCWWDVRWLMYSHPVSSLIPGVSRYASIDPILEVPGILVLLLAGYILGYRSTFALWRRRFSNYRDALTINALTINTILLLMVTVLGITEWLILYGLVPLDLIVVVSLGTVAAFTSIYLEKRPRWPRPLPYSDFHRVAPRGRTST